MALNLEQLLPDIIAIAKLAGQAILPYYGQPVDALSLRHKLDDTPLTQADLAANQMIVQQLQLLTPDIPILSEEGELADYQERQHWSTYWLIDPLDGTRGFVDGSDEFTVNIALVHQHQAILGVVYSPVKQLCYYAMQAGQAWLQKGDDTPVPISARHLDWQHYIIVLGRYLRKNAALQIYQVSPGAHIERLNSSLKFCYLAEGRADIYPRLGDTGEWDTAASQIILEQAGGVLIDLNGQPLQYNTRSTLINPPFVALGDGAQAQRVIDFIQENRRNS